MSGPPPRQFPPGSPPGAPPRGPPPNTPPPARPPVQGAPTISIKGVGENELKRPPGPPPRTGPISQLKPPPIAPPPRDLLQNTQRPSVQNIKGIEIPKGPPPRSTLPINAENKSAPPARAPPPRAPPVLDAVNTQSSSKIEIGINNSSAPILAPPKMVNQYKPPSTRKAGAISMFEPPEEPIPTADKKQKIDEAGGVSESITSKDEDIKMDTTIPTTSSADANELNKTQASNKSVEDKSSNVSDAKKVTSTEVKQNLEEPLMKIKTPRPLPPKALPPGIPEGQPLPPQEDPNQATKRPAAPVRPAPQDGKPVVKDPNMIQKKEKPPDPEPPTTPAPFIKGKRVVVEEEVFVPRRERENPEFESSSDEDDADFPAVKKQEISHSIKKLSGDMKTGLDKNKAGATGATPKQSKEEMDAVSLVEVPEPIVPKKFDAKDMKPEFTKVPGSADISVAETLDTIAEVKSMTAALPATTSAPENIVTTYVPPPPSDFSISPDESNLASEIKGGRFSVRCIAGIDIKRKSDPNKIPRLDPYIKFKLGSAEKLPWKLTQTIRKQDNNPVFNNEIISFDVLDPAAYIYGNDLQLYIELWNKSSFKDELLGSVTMSVVRFFKTPYVVFNEKMPIYAPGEKGTTQKLNLEFSFEEARNGLVVITLYEARGLRQLDPLGQQDPYVQLSLGPRYKKRSKTIKDGGVEPYFTEENILLWTDKENWVNDLRIELLDEHIGDEKVIGFTHFSLLPYMNTRMDEVKDEAFDLFYEFLVDPKDEKSRKEVACGEIVLRVQHFPAGNLTINFTKAKDLTFPETFTPISGTEKRIDPYVSATLEGQAVKMVKKTPVDKDGGTDPSWEYDIFFDIVDQYLVDIDVYHQNPQGTDVLLGSAQLSLLATFRAGRANTWLTLKQKKSNGGLKEIGVINVSTIFWAPPNLSYPLYRTNVDSFDDTVRKLPPAKKDKLLIEEEKLPEPVNTDPESYLKDKFGREIVQEPEALVASELNKNEAGESVEEIPPEFTHEEIVAAFKFIDLDHNNFVGASEIRHILVCMGEMITDEEIDTMISMVDLDGDGQVSFAEFKTLVLHPDPGKADIHSEVTAYKEKEIEQEKQALAGKPVGLDLTSFQRQKEMILRETKKKAILNFISDNEIDFDGIRHGYENFTAIPKEKRIGGRIKFDLFCHVLRVEPITEYRKLFDLFDSESLGDVDLREFLLSMLNFVAVDKEVRIRFSFQMYDEGKSGFITQKEIEEILRGNHMIGIASVQRKAETIMKQAVSNKTGSITINEFVVVSKKFPNILLPVLDVKK